MSDIVERLRLLEINEFSTHPLGMLDKAADEIEQNRIDLEEYRLDVERLRAALEAALEDGAGVSYCDEDECGNYVCCGEVSYKPHAPDCWTLKARAALSGEQQ